MAKTWTEFDMAWLQLRHQFMQRYDLDKGLYPRDLSDVDDDPPIFDLAQALMANISSQDTNISENSLSARYHCFSEVSKWVTDRNADKLHDEPLQAIVQTNKYLRDIMLFNEANGFDSFTNFCNIATHVESKDMINLYSLPLILHQENLFFFFQSLDPAWSPKEYDTGSRKHKLELAIRLSTHIHNSKYKHSSTAARPTFFLELLRIRVDKDNDSFLWQWVNIFSTFFQNAICVQMPYTLGGTLQTSQHTPRLTRYLAYLSLEGIFSLNEGLGPAIQGTLIDTFQTIAENLNEQMSSPDFREPNLLFYLTGLYLCSEKHYREMFRGAYRSQKTYHTSLDGLISTMWTYKERTIDAGIINSDLEEIYGRETDTWSGPPFRERFSSKWWDFLDSPQDPSHSGSLISSRRSHPSMKELTIPPPPDP
ncbi:hypothetical protein GALMADRAFT_706962 [Galerina marginata CBS 339.88]|uniref:Uncharacterized protein n=1 Tax=Galerina marginata (strain CBS 339.88) TaxID=685588 RepID=A0A067TM33_GALM3|nr:hypothetical protein GALMADRAFT_706962 [Galerina marginata CBS 339.88]